MDRFLVCAAYYIVAARYHSGAASKGYAKLSQLSRMRYRPGPLMGQFKGSEERNAAACLLWTRRKEIRANW